MKYVNRFALIIIATLMIISAINANAIVYNNFLVFGDSLSDTGNVDRKTDGLLWVESLNTTLGSVAYNYAFAGATTSFDNPAAAAEAFAMGASTSTVAFLQNTGIQSQTIMAQPDISSIDMNNTLVSVWGGANDFLNSRDFATAASNIGNVLDGLYIGGARDFLVGNLPDLGLTAAIYGSPSESIATSWTLAYNSALAAVLTGFQATYPDANIYDIDAYGIFGSYTPGSPEWLDLFWIDGFHPSSTGHQLIYENAISVIPEPNVYILFSLGLISFITLRIKRKI